MAHTKRSTVAGLIFTVAVLLGIPMAAGAQTNAYGLWLASGTPSESQTAAAWGRMTLKDGVLVFSAQTVNWQVPVNEITRVTERKGVNRQFTIETVSGGVMHFSILGQQMLPESPRKAMQVIERAVRETPAPRPTMVVAAGGGSY